MQYITKIGEDLVEAEIQFTWDDDYIVVEAVVYKGIDIMPAIEADQVEKIRLELQAKPDSYWEDDDFDLED